MYDIIIIGGGAAGMTAALYSLRSGKTVLLLEKESIGVKIVENILKKQSGNVLILRNVKHSTVLKLKNLINLKK